MALYILLHQSFYVALQLHWNSRVSLWGKTEGGVRKDKNARCIPDKGSIYFSDEGVNCETGHQWCPGRSSLQLYSTIHRCERHLFSVKEGGKCETGHQWCSLQLYSTIHKCERQVREGDKQTPIPTNSRWVWEAATWCVSHNILDSDSSPRAREIKFQFYAVRCLW